MKRPMMFLWYSLLLRTNYLTVFLIKKSNYNVPGSHKLWRRKNIILPRKSYPMVIQFHKGFYSQKTEISCEDNNWLVPPSPIWFKCLCLRLETGPKIQTRGLCWISLLVLQAGIVLNLPKEPSEPHIFYF